MPSSTHLILGHNDDRVEVYLHWVPPDQCDGFWDFGIDSSYATSSITLSEAQLECLMRVLRAWPICPSKRDRLRERLRTQKVHTPTTEDADADWPTTV